jgi:hypothetical protein
MTKASKSLDELSARVMYASDRQCCICRDGNLRTQIHHIDGDHSHNVFENLAVLCLDCHSQAHSKEAFVRNLTPAMIQLYNQSWRAIVRMRLSPAADPDGYREFVSEVYLEVSLGCHYWKLEFFSMRPEGIFAMPKGDFTDVWDSMIEMAPTTYSQAVWTRYQPLFASSIDRVLNHFDRTLTLYSGILPLSFKTLLVRSRRRLQTVQRTYPAIPKFSLPGMDSGSFLKQSFDDSIHTIGHVAREADRLQKAATDQP